MQMMLIYLLTLFSISSVTIHAFFGGTKIKTLKSLVVTDAEYPVLPQNIVNQLVDLTTTSPLQPYLLGVILFILPIPGFGQFGMNNIENKDKEKDGKAISAALQGGFSKLIAVTNPGAISVPKGYKRFPNDNGIETLQHFLRSNSFFATALIPDGSGYKISSSDKSNRFSKYIAIMDPALDRVDAKFDSQMRLIDIRYEGKKEALKDEEANIAAAKLTWNLSYVAEIFHISLHVLHYMMTVGLIYATLEDKVLQSWAKIYTYNLDSSVDGVANSLVPEKDGLLIVAPAKTDRDKMLALMRSTVSEWGNLKSSEDFKKWLFPPALLTKLQKDGHMTGFLTHESFVKDYAAELSGTLKDANVVAYNEADDRLKSFLSSVGSSKSQPLCKVSNIKTWIELMAVTGLFHGQTSSWSRLSFSNTFYRYVNSNPKYDKPESKFAGLAAITMNIAQKDQYVFKNKNKGPTSVIQVISKYDKITCDIKKIYLEKSKKEEYFNEYGWIYADFFTDHFDGRSTGITYY